MKLLLIDNYDSFTYNLYHYLGELGAEVHVERNDALSVPDVQRMNMDAVVLSPGPCTPNEAGICLDLIDRLGATTPIFGVCLGMQAMGQVYGGEVVRAPELWHGKVDQVHHNNEGIFAGLESPFKATRYHSLVVERSTLPDVLEVTAHTQDGLIMGMQHKSYPVHGVQFHPESIATDFGHAMLNNFLRIVRAHEKQMQDK
jgi:anthranilate synthase component 2